MPAAREPFTLPLRRPAVGVDPSEAQGRIIEALLTHQREEREDEEAVVPKVADDEVEDGRAAALRMVQHHRRVGHEHRRPAHLPCERVPQDHWNVIGGLFTARRPHSVVERREGLRRQHTVQGANPWPTPPVAVAPCPPWVALQPTLLTSNRRCLPSNRYRLLSSRCRLAIAYRPTAVESHDRCLATSDGWTPLGSRTVVEHRSKSYVKPRNTIWLRGHED